jgi:YD repeat-containing protein
LTKLIDSAAGTFTAAYDIEGRMTSEVYPNGMCANTGYSATGQATSLQYVKTRNCLESGAPVWFNDTVLSGIHGETLAQTSTLSGESYAYDQVGRLTEVGEEPVGKGCIMRLYAYDEESNRTSLTTREPAGEGKCATTGGTIQQHAYDEANRLVDTGVEYEAFGNTTKLPAADAGEHEIQSTYYVDSQVATQTQNGETLKYTYDPLGRTMETVSEGRTSSTVISHYAGPGAAVTWTSEGAEKWTRSIPGIDGSLSAVQTSSTAPVLQLHDLQGNIVGTASLSESETKLLSTYDSTEFGVPQPGTTPPKYAWLGADGITSELSSGVVAHDGVTYVPLTGEPLQTQPVEIPLPNKYYEPYETPSTAGGTWGPIASALRIAEY